MKFSKSWYLFLDDFRNPKEVTWVELPLTDWTIARTYFEFIAFIRANGLPKFISFDHDLGDKAMKEYITAKEKFCYDNLGDEKTGMDCAKWLVEYCMDNNLDIPKFEVHSFNNVGAENIRCYLNNYIAFRRAEKLNVS